MQRGIGRLRAKQSSSPELNPNPGPDFSETTGYAQFVSFPASTGPEIVDGSIHVIADPLLFGGPDIPVVEGVTYRVIVEYRIISGVVGGVTLNQSNFSTMRVQFGTNLGAGTYLDDFEYTAVATENIEVDWDARFAGSSNVELYIDRVSVKAI